MNTKTCTKCGIDKPLNDYYNHKRRKDGKEATCKKCRSKNSRKNYEANRELRLIQSRAWYEMNRERKTATTRAWTEANLEHHRAATRQWYKANKERHDANRRAWRKANPERTRIHRQKYYKANSERQKANVYARRARLAHAVPQRWKRSLCPDHLCYWCGTTLTPETTHIDHIMPISLGGQDTPDNTANTCASCNLTKSNAHPLVWLARITTPEPVC